MSALPEEERRGRGPWPVVLTTALVVALVGVAAFLLVRELTGSGQQVRVPEVVGRQEDVARNLLERAGFIVARETEASDKEAGEVIDQVPEPGDLVDEGSEVTIVVSAGPELVEVPDLTGKTAQEAADELEAVELIVGQTTEEASEDFEPGQVISQNPAAAEQAPAGSAVDLVISSGPETVAVPSVVCDPVELAREKIRSAGLKFKRATPEFSDECPDPGTIARTDPAAGEQVKPNSTVLVFESLGPTPLPTITITPSPSPTE
jgi:eukaryotic-like serine/threonine-protein kinase